MSEREKDTWSAALYSRFEKERNQPVYDLLNRVPTNDVKTAADVGCGPGNSTEILQQRYPTARLTGMDSSANMIAAACERLPDVHFEVADIATWNNYGPFDLILSNAVLQWVPNHEQIIPGLLNRLSPGGVLAIQMPDNFNEPTHRIMREIASSGEWAKRLVNAQKRLDRKPAEWYFDLLHGRVVELDIWRTTYYHPIKTGAAGIVEMVKSTGLRPYLDALGVDEQEAFISQYTAEVTMAYPAQPDGTVLLPYPRLFIVAKNNAYISLN